MNLSVAASLFTNIRVALVLLPVTVDGALAQSMKPEFLSRRGALYSGLRAGRRG